MYSSGAGKPMFTRASRICVCAALAVSCSQPQREVRYSSHELSVKEPVAAFSTPADLRLTFVRSPNSPYTFCAEPMPDVALGSTLEVSGAAKGSLAAEASMSSSYASSLKDINESIRKENEALRHELEKALDEYKKETGRELKTSVESSLSLASASANKSNSNLELQAAAKLAATVSELGGRSQQVLLAREFLYRLCEARANGFFAGGQAYVDMQQNALRMIESISKAAEKTPVEKRTELLKQGLELQKARASLCADIKKSCLAVAETKTTQAEIKAAKDACEVDSGKCLAKAAFEEGPLPSPKSDEKSAEAKGTILLMEPSSSSNLIRTTVAPDPEPAPKPAPAPKPEPAPKPAPPAK